MPGAVQVAVEHAQLGLVAVGHRERDAVDPGERLDGQCRVPLREVVAPVEPPQPRQPAVRLADPDRLTRGLPDRQRLQPGRDRLLDLVGEVALVGQPGQQRRAFPRGDAVGVAQRPSVLLGRHRGARPTRPTGRRPQARAAAPRPRRPRPRRGGPSARGSARAPARPRRRRSARRGTPARSAPGGAAPSAAARAPARRRPSGPARAGSRRVSPVRRSTPRSRASSSASNRSGEQRGHQVQLGAGARDRGGIEHLPGGRGQAGGPRQHRVADGGWHPSPPAANTSVTKNGLPPVTRWISAASRPTGLRLLHQPGHRVDRQRRQVEPPGARRRRGVAQQDPGSGWSAAGSSGR